MNDTKSHIILWVFSLVPYTLVAWGYTAITDSGLAGFGKAFGVLWLVRLFFGLIETLGGVLAWRTYAKHQMVKKFLQMLRAEKFPKRLYRHDDFVGTLHRIMDEEIEVDEAARANAKAIYQSLVMTEGTGILAGMRIHAATDAAFDLYSPRIEAPEWTTLA